MANLRTKLTAIMILGLGTLAGCSPQESPSIPAPGSNEVPKLVAPSDNAAPIEISEADSAVTPMPSVSEAPVVGAQWNYSKTEDPMGGGYHYNAAVSSKNKVDFRFPYNGPQRAMLMLASNPRSGKLIVLGIEKGQILCPSYAGCVVLVRFDDGAAVKYSATAPSDGSVNAIILNGYSSFVQNMKKSKVVKISANIYQQGSPIFEFDVDGFDERKYSGK